MAIRYLWFDPFSTALNVVNIKVIRTQMYEYAGARDLELYQRFQLPFGVQLLLEFGSLLRRGEEVFGQQLSVVCEWRPGVASISTRSRWAQAPIGAVSCRCSRT